MNRVMFFVDGFNLCHSLNDKQEYHKYKWLNIKKLCHCFVSKKDTIVGIKYFTAYAMWRPDSFARRKIFIRALESTGEIEIVFGKFRYKDKKCPLCNKVFTAHEEKRTDVNIAIALFENGMFDRYDTAIIISGDSDLIPAIKAAKLNFPNKKFGIVVPIERRAEELKNIADFHMKIKEEHLASSQFPDTIDIGSNQKLNRPLTWK